MDSTYTTYLLMTLSFFFIGILARYISVDPAAFFKALAVRVASLAWKLISLLIRLLLLVITTTVGLLYFVLPIDIVPDILLGIGYIEDVLLLGAGGMFALKVSLPFPSILRLETGERRGRNGGRSMSSKDSSKPRLSYWVATLVIGVLSSMLAAPLTVLVNRHLEKVASTEVGVGPAQTSPSTDHQIGENQSENPEVRSSRASLNTFLLVFVLCAGALTAFVVFVDWLELFDLHDFFG